MRDAPGTAWGRAHPRERREFTPGAPSPGWAGRGHRREAQPRRTYLWEENGAVQPPLLSLLGGEELPGSLPMQFHASLTLSLSLSPFFFFKPITHVFTRQVEVPRPGIEPEPRQ